MKLISLFLELQKAAPTENANKHWCIILLYTQKSLNIIGHTYHIHEHKTLPNKYPVNSPTINHVYSRESAVNNNINESKMLFRRIEQFSRAGVVQ